METIQELEDERNRLMRDFAEYQKTHAAKLARIDEAINLVRQTAANALEFARAENVLDAMGQQAAGDSSAAAPTMPPAARPRRTWQGIPERIELILQQRGALHIDEIVREMNRTGKPVKKPNISGLLERYVLLQKRFEKTGRATFAIRTGQRGVSRKNAGNVGATAGTANAPLNNNPSSNGDKNDKGSAAVNVQTGGSSNKETEQPSRNLLKKVGGEKKIVPLGQMVKPTVDAAGLFI